MIISNISIFYCFNTILFFIKYIYFLFIILKRTFLRGLLLFLISAYEAILLWFILIIYILLFSYCRQLLFLYNFGLIFCIGLLILITINAIYRLRISFCHLGIIIIVSFDILFYLFFLYTWFYIIFLFCFLFKYNTLC